VSDRRPVPDQAHVAAAGRGTRARTERLIDLSSTNLVIQSLNAADGSALVSPLTTTLISEPASVTPVRTYVLAEKLPIESWYKSLAENAHARIPLQFETLR